jgi:glycosyltransferase involved in cell wall biosynthesis
MLVSIITVTYNRAHLIGETIQSVLDQTFQNFEQIIIDDGSTDTTESVVKNFNDDRIKYFKYDKIGNISALLNLGIQHSNGEYIAVLDSDDLWVKHKLETIINVFNNDDTIQLATHDIQYFSDKNELQKKYFNYESDFYKNILVEVLTFKFIPFSVFTFKRNLLETVGAFDEKFIVGDHDFFIRVAIDNRIYFHNECLAQIRLHPSNTHKTINTMPFFNYYSTVFSLVFNNQIGLGLFLKGFFFNSKNLIKYILRNE